MSCKNVEKKQNLKNYNNKLFASKNRFFLGKGSILSLTNEISIKFSIS
jgi:hypothetical protein